MHRMMTLCVFCGKTCPDSVQPELFKCCGNIGQTIDVPACEDDDPIFDDGALNEEYAFYASLERGYVQDRI